MTPALPSEISAVARRWPKTDRLVLSRLLSAAGEDAKLRPDVTGGTDRVSDAHAIFEVELVAMKNTHHAKMTELLISENVDWVQASANDHIQREFTFD